MTNAKKVSWVLLYLTAIIPTGLFVYYFSEEKLLPGLIASLISISIYTFLIIKDLKFLSSLSFFTMPFISLLMLGINGNNPDGSFSSPLGEKAFLLIIPLILPFFLISSIYWTRTKQGFKKLISLIYISLSVLILIIFGTNPPTYYQNFIYTRINILILFIFSIFLIVKRKKLLGILGIFLSIGILFTSAGMFSQKTYKLSEQEQKEVIACVDPIAKEMFGYYNKEDYDNFCKHCGYILKNMLKHNPIKNNRDVLGPYVYFDKPSSVIRKGGRFYVEYPVKFKNVKNIMYLTFVIENISSEPSIYGFSFSNEQE